MRLAQLLAGPVRNEIESSTPGDPDVTGIQFDSRLVRPGDLFVAVDGYAVDGHRFIQQAVAAGAVAVVGQRQGLTTAVPYVTVVDSRAALAALAAAFYDLPAQKMRVIGVTGTDGKTTTTSLIHAVLSAARFQAHMITTIGARIGRSMVDLGLHVTTPDALTMQHLLAQMVAAGAEYAVLEATSHGLSQHRVRHCAFDVAVVTNVTHEHLDFHRTPEAYLEAKASLFHGLRRESTYKPDTPKASILNADDSSFAYLAGIDADLQITYGLEHTAAVTAVDVVYGQSGTSFTAVTPATRFSVNMPLVGEHNVYNALAAIAVAHAEKIPVAAVAQGLASVARITARMEPIECGQDFGVYVDYAHTANAIAKTLQAARRLTERRLIVVCGLSGGLRDRSKRPILGRIVGQLADKIVITAMDWYDEDVADIMSAIAAGCREAGRLEEEDFWCIRDRAEGIGFGISLAEPGDIVVIAGKAHETAINYGDVELPWDEIATIRAALTSHHGECASPQTPGDSN